MDLGGRGIGISLRRADGAPCLAHVMPLRVGQIRPGVAKRTTAAVFVAPAASHRECLPTPWRCLYDLTPAESRIFEMIVDGQVPSDIAALLGIVPGTVRTHLLRVFEKTGCSRQFELVSSRPRCRSQSERALESPGACVIGRCQTVRLRLGHPV
jgi:DNA-binding CsgD family transcriptional regulator